MNDYISKRLQIRVDNQEQTQNTHMIYARLMNLNAFLQILIESSIVERNKMLSNDKLVSQLNKGDLRDAYFVLPSILTSYYSV